MNWKGKSKLLKCVREDIAGGVCDNTLLSVPPEWPTRQIKILFFFFLFLAFPVDRIGLGITDLANPIYVKRILPFYFPLIYNFPWHTAHEILCHAHLWVLHWNHPQLWIFCVFHLLIPHRAFLLVWLTFMWIKPGNGDRTAIDLMHMAI